MKGARVLAVMAGAHAACSRAMRDRGWVWSPSRKGDDIFGITEFLRRSSELRKKLFLVDRSNGSRRQDCDKPPIIVIARGEEA
jgi:hypothetical protein